MLATDLSDPEIVLGKLAARLLPVFGLVACSWPVLVLSSLLGGIDPLAVTLAFAIILAVVLLGCSMAPALSVWARKPHEVVLVVYTFWPLVLLLWPIWYALAWTKLVGPPPGWSLVADPYYLAFAPILCPAGSISGTISVSSQWHWGQPSSLALLAVWRMSPCRAARDRRRPQGTTDRLGRPAVAMAARTVARWHPVPGASGIDRASRWTTILVVLVGG